jgi:hypothetical protein
VTETTHKKIQDGFVFYEGDPEFQLMTEEKIAVVIFFYLFSSALPMLLNFPCVHFLSLLFLGLLLLP